MTGGFGLMALAIVVLALAWGDTLGLTDLGALGMGALWCGAGALLLPLRRRNLAPSTRWGLLALLTLAPAAGELALRAWASNGSGAEFVLLAGLAQAGLFLAASSEPLWRPLVLPVSLSVCAIAFCLSHTPLAAAATAVYVVALAESLRRGYRRPSAHRRSRRRAPVFVALAGAAALAPALSHGDAPGIGALAALMAGSGGSAGSDPYGRGGIGEGEGEVGATHKTEDIGFAETDVFVETPRRSLYDAVDEVMGEPRDKRKPQNDRRVVLKAREILDNPNSKIPARPAASRTFSTLRRLRDTHAGAPRNAAAQTLLSVRGRTPIHLRMTTYDRFDGVRWAEAPPDKAQPPLRPEGSFWMRLTQRSLPDVFGAVDTQEVRVGQLQTHRLPVPDTLERVRVGKVRQLDFFRWAQADILRLDVAMLPGGTNVESETRALDPERARRRRLIPHPITRRYLPEGFSPQIGALARRWTEGVAPGWAQAEALAAALQRHAVHDRRATVPESVGDPIAWFLLEGRRGPDYLFATSAALMLRELGYRTRLVSGFYVSGARPERNTGLQAVVPQDTHFWVEVMLDPAQGEEAVWAPLEATPGYALRPPRIGWEERLRSALEASKALLTRHAVALSAVAGLAAGAWRLRPALLDALGVWQWRWWRVRDRRRALALALRLIERRAAWAGCGRPPGVTARRHFAPAPDDPLAALLAAADWALYAPSACDGAPTIDPAEAALRHWTRRRWKERVR